MQHNKNIYLTFREMLGLTKVQVSNATGLSISTIQRIERGKSVGKIYENYLYMYYMMKRRGENWL